MKCCSELPFVFLPNVVLLTKINQICDGLGRQKLKSINNIDLGDAVSLYTSPAARNWEACAHVVEKEVITYNEHVSPSQTA